MLAGCALGVLLFARAGVTSRERYALELAGGDWIDSRLAARRRLQALQGQALALR